MKTINKSLMVLGLLFFALQGCTHEDYTPVPGPAGADGTNGTNGINGTTECATCHSKAHTGPVIASYALSVHAIETLHETTNASGATISLKTSEYTNRTGCVQCHTSQGYIDNSNGDVLKTGTGTALGFPAYPGGKQAISCTTCHNKHSSFDFKTDGNDFALRQGFRPVALDVDPSVKMDMGTSNTCVNCHQPRGLPPTTATVTLSSRFGPHHGPQSTLLEGIQGALIVGSTAYPAPQSAKHRSGASCVTCHMGKTTDSKDGAHTWHPTKNACITCHASGAPASVSGYEADMLILKDLLVKQGAFSLATDAFIDKKSVSLKVAQAAWNYALLREDRSHGVHNPGYAKALLKNSIEALQ